MNKFNFKNFVKEISKNKLTIFICVFFSVILWISTILYNSDSYSVIKIKDVPIISSFSNTQAEQLGLSVFDLEPKTVSMYVRGPRHKLSFLKKEDFVVAPKNYGNILTSGKYNLELNAYLKKPQQDVTIESISHRNVMFFVDALETKSINLISDETNIKVEDGFMKDKAVCEPNNLFVSGPKEQVDKLDSIKLFIDSTPCILNASKTFNAKPKFVAANGDFLEGRFFKYNKDVKFSVTVPVYKVKKLPLKILYKNVPQALDVNLLKIRIEPKDIEIGGSQDAIRNINELNLGYVDLRELCKEKTEFSFNIVPSKGFKNINQVSSATVYFDENELYSKKFDVKEPQLLNIPQNCEISVNSKTIQNVSICGFYQYIKEIGAQDLTATIDCSNLDLKDGKQNVPVNIGVTKNGVWPVGEYKCSIEVKRKG